MRRYVISIFVLVLMAAGITAALFYVKDTTDRLYTIAASAMQAAKNEEYEETIECLLQLKEAWKQREAMFTLFVRHDHIDLLTDSLAKLAVYVEHRNFEEVEVQLGTMMYQLKNVWESELPTFTNVF